MPWRGVGAGLRGGAAGRLVVASCGRPARRKPSQAHMPCLRGSPARQGAQHRARCCCCCCCCCCCAFNPACGCSGLADVALRMPGQQHATSITRPRLHRQRVVGSGRAADPCSPRAAPAAPLSRALCLCLRLRACPDGGSGPRHPPPAVGTQPAWPGAWCAVRLVFNGGVGPWWAYMRAPPAHVRPRPCRHRTSCNNCTRRAPSCSCDCPSRGIPAQHRTVDPRSAAPAARRARAHHRVSSSRWALQQIGIGLRTAVALCWWRSAMPEHQASRGRCVVPELSARARWAWPGLQRAVH